MQGKKAKERRVKTRSAFRKGLRRRRADVMFGEGNVRGGPEEEEDESDKREGRSGVKKMGE
jgi:hypothetical protein